MGRSRLADDLLSAWLVFFLNLPALVVIMLAYIWIGLNETAAIFAVAAQQDPERRRHHARGRARARPRPARDGAGLRGRPLAARCATSSCRSWRPSSPAAARSGLALIWKIVLVVELLGRSNGVGFQLGLYFQLFDVASILAYALAFILVVQVIEWCVLQPLEQAASRWRR